MTTSEKYSKELTETAEKIALEEFDKARTEHRFSTDYNNRKADFLKSIENDRQKQKKQQTKKIIAVAASLLIAIPTTAFAAKKLYDVIVKKNHYEVNVSVEGQANPTKKNQHYKLKLGYLPTNMKDYYGDGIKYWYEDNYAKGGFSFNLFKINQTAEFTDLSVEDYQEKTFGKNRVVITTTGSGGRESLMDRHAYLIFEEEGFVLEIFVGNDVPETDLEQVLSQISLEPTSKEKETHFQNYDELEMSQDEESYEITTKPLAKASPQLFNIGEKVPLNGFNYTIEKVEVRESIADLPQENFTNGFLEQLQEKKMLNQEGMLIPFERKTYKVGDGRKTIDQVVSRQMIQPKFVYITATFENRSDYPIEDLYMQNGVTLLKESPNGWTNDGISGQYYEPSVSIGEVDYLDSHGEGKGFYRMPTFQPHEKRTIHIGYFVEEDQLSKMFLNVFYYAGMENNVDDLEAPDRLWVDIRQSE